MRSVKTNFVPTPQLPQKTPQTTPQTTPQRTQTTPQITPQMMPQITQRRLKKCGNMKKKLTKSFDRFL